MNQKNATEMSEMMEMEMEMEMRSIEDMEVEVGEDLTPPIPPLASSLSDAFLQSHCSSCFHPLKNPPSSNPDCNSSVNGDTIFVLYCSPNCSNVDTVTHFSSGEHHLFLIFQSQPTTWHGDTTDLRTALRLLLSFEQLGLLSTLNDGRISGLMSNRGKFEVGGDDSDEVLERIREGGRLMAMARRMRDDGRGEIKEDNNLVEETVLCVVLTNAVEVQVNEQQALGIAVYGPEFSWINHSCSPNACYRFSLSGSQATQKFGGMRIAASGEEDVLKTWVCDERELKNGICVPGPRIVVRSIKAIKKGDEVCIAYTDLLQPKATRQSELWLKYRFWCCCWRCSASPPTYVDHLLQEYASALPLDASRSCSKFNLNRSEAYKELTDCFDDIISEYFSVGDPVSCCEKLERVLSQNLQEAQSEEPSNPSFKLHPLHRLSLDAYITLASAYKIRATNLLELHSRRNNHIRDVFELSKTSTAYYFLLAGATQHLLRFESSLISTAAQFWISAGESFLCLVRSPFWYSNLNGEASTIHSSSNYSCPKCMLIDKWHFGSISDQSQSLPKQTGFEQISKSFLGCISNLIPKIWPFMTSNHHYLKYVENPIDFTWIAAKKNPVVGCCRHVGFPCERRTSSRNEANEGTNEEIIATRQLAAHCLLYGAYLASICYSPHCYLTGYARNLLLGVDT